MMETRKYSLIKPGNETPFHIDFEWWVKYDNDWRIFMQSYLCSEHQSIFSNFDQDTTIDWIDPKTAEVIQVDGLQHILMTHCAKQPGFITNSTTLVDAVFRVFLSNSNTAMSPVELSKQIQRPAETILRTLAGPQVYKGLRPCPKPK
jgi:hypothetical protein